jgi:hypothetical protein
VCANAIHIHSPSAPVARYCRGVDAGQPEDANSADDVSIGSLPCVALVAATVDGQDYARGGSMGIDMQIVYFGFAGSAQIEAEAAAQLVRLERFCKSISGCHLAIEAIRERALSEIAGARRAAPEATPHHLMFDARLDLVLRTGELLPLGHQQSADPDSAVRAAFDAAELLLERGAARI